MQESSAMATPTKHINIPHQEKCFGISKSAAQLTSGIQLHKLLRVLCVEQWR